MGIGTRSITIGPHLGAGIGGASGISLVGLSVGLYHGQSNNQGFNSPLTPAGVTMARAITLPQAAGYDQPTSNVWEFRKFGSTPPDPPTWLTTGGVVQGPVPLGPRLVNAEEQAGNFGIALGLGRYLDRSQPRNWVLGGFALGGTTLNSNWKAPGGSYPSGVGVTRLADQFIAFGKSIEALTQTPTKFIYQSLGTSDALAGAVVAGNYGTNLTNYWGYVLPFFPGALVFIEQISSVSGGGADLTTVRNAQAAFVAANPGVAFLVSAENLPIPGVEANLTHYPANAYIIMGERLGAGVLGALSIPEVPRAEFRYFGTGLSVQFTDLSVNANSAVNAWSWDFGDGATSTNQSPSHTYAGAGTYTVKLTATSANGKSQQVSHSVVVVASVGWTVDATAGIACPSTLAEENAFLAAAGLSGPCSHLWLMQANCQSTPFQDPDQIGGVPLGANGAFTSQSASAAWSRVGNLWADNVANRHLSSTAAGLPDCSVTPTLLVSWWDMPASAPVGGANRGFVSIGVTGNGDIRIGITTGKLQQNATVNTPIVTNICNGGRQFVAIQDTLSEVIIYTEQERFVLPRRTPATGKSVGFGGFTANSPAARCVYSKLYRDAAAQKTVDEMRAYFRCAGWNPLW